MKKFIITILILGILGGAGYGVYHFYFEKKAGSEERVSSDADNAVYVDSVSTITGYGVGTGLVERFGGEVSPQATLEVKLENERTVKKCYVKEGDEVKEGQRLFTYDTREDEDKVAQAEIDIEKAESDIELAKQSIEEYEEQKKTADKEDQLMITTSILSSQNEIKQYEYDIKSKQMEMEQLKETIENSTVTAEMGGIIQKINDPGSSEQDYYGGSGSDSAYITILAVGDFRIKGTANEQNLQQIQEGMGMIVHSRVDDTKTWLGTVTEIDTDNKEENDEDTYYSGMGSESGSSNYTFYVELEDSEGLILGQHVYMEQDSGQTEKKEGMWLEEYYIMQEDDGDYVWWANSSNTIEKHAITLGDYDEELMQYQVLDGLAPEDYIAYPMETISEGDPVIYNDFTDDTSDGDFEDTGYDDMDMGAMDDEGLGDVDMGDMGFDDADMSDMGFDDAGYDDIDMGDEGYDDMDTGMDDADYEDIDMGDENYDEMDGEEAVE